MKLFSKNFNPCDHNTPTLQTDGRTDRQFIIAIPRYATLRAVKTGPGLESLIIDYLANIGLHCPVRAWFILWCDDDYRYITDSSICYRLTAIVK